MDDELLLYAEDHPDGRQFTSTAITTDEAGLEIRNRSRTADGQRRWDRRYARAEAHAVVALLGGDAEDLSDPAAFLHRMAAAGDLPTDQTLDGWLAEHGVPGETVVEDA